MVALAHNKDLFQPYFEDRIDKMNWNKVDKEAANNLLEKRIKSLAGEKIIYDQTGECVIALGSEAAMYRILQAFIKEYAEGVATCGYLTELELHYFRLNF